MTGSGLGARRWTLYPRRRAIAAAVAAGAGLTVAVILRVADGSTPVRALLGLALAIAAPAWLVGAGWAPLRGEVPPPHPNVFVRMPPITKRRALRAIRGRRPLAAGDDIEELRLGALQLGRASGRGSVLSLGLIGMGLGNALHADGGFLLALGVIAGAAGAVGLLSCRRDRRRAAEFLDLLPEAAPGPGR